MTPRQTLYNYTPAGREAAERYRVSEKGRQTARDKAARAARREPEKTNARHRLQRAVRTGKIVPQPCELCGAMPVQAHHPFGYEGLMALAVWWLCRVHHKAMHQFMSGISRPNITAEGDPE